MKRIIMATLLGAAIALVSAYPFCVAFFLCGYLEDGKAFGPALIGALAYSIFATVAVCPLSAIAGAVTGFGVSIFSRMLKRRRSLVVFVALVIGAIVGVVLLNFLKSLRIPFGELILNWLPAYSGAIAAGAMYFFEKVYSTPNATTDR